MKNLNRLTAAASRQAALQDLRFVYLQLKDHNPQVELSLGAGHRLIDRETQRLIDWAKENGYKIDLPEGWKESKP